MTFHRQLAAALFFTGMLVQLAVPLYMRMERDYERVLLFPPLIIMVFIAHFLFDGNGYDLALFAAMFITLLLLILFVNEAMPVLSKYHAASFTVLFWYVFSSLPHQPGSGWLTPWALVFAISASVVSVGGMMARGRALAMLKPVMYVWYLVVSAYVCVSQLQWNMLDFLLSDIQALTKIPGPLTALTDGMMLMYACTTVALVYDLYAMVSFYTNNMSSIRKRQLYLSAKFTEADLKPSGLLLALLLPMVLVVINFRFGLLRPFLLTNIFMVGVPYVLSPPPLPEPADEGE